MHTAPPPILPSLSGRAPLRGSLVPRRPLASTPAELDSLVRMLFADLESDREGRYEGPDANGDAPCVVTDGVDDAADQARRDAELGELLAMVMGYSTTFKGSFKLDRPLAPEHAEYLRAFNWTRRMRRHPRVAEMMTDPRRVAVGLPIGDQGGFFVGGGDFRGQENDASIADFNEPPRGQPSLWCQWVPTKDGSGIEWDGGEKFYSYVPWLRYLVSYFIEEWGYRLTGEVRWQGEDRSDRGRIVCMEWGFKNTIRHQIRKIRIVRKAALGAESVVAAGGGR